MQRWGQVGQRSRISYGGSQVEKFTSNDNKWSEAAREGRIRQLRPWGRGITFPWRQSEKSPQGEEHDKVFVNKYCLRQRVIE